MIGASRSFVHSWQLKKVVTGALPMELCGVGLKFVKN